MVALFPVCSGLLNRHIIIVLELGRKIRRQVSSLVLVSLLRFNSGFWHVLCYSKFNYLIASI